MVPCLKSSDLLKKLFIAGFLLAFFTTSIHALDCGSENTAIALTSQAEVDAFQVDHGAGGTCDRVLGALRISGEDIASLLPLADIREIGVYLEISGNPLLATLEGLSGLERINNSLRIRENDALESLAELTSLVYVGPSSNEPQPWDCWTVEIRNNPVLADIDGLYQLTQASCDIRLRDNPALLDLDGLSGMVLIGGSLEIGGNTSLVSIDGLANLDEVGSGTVVSLEISDTQLTNLDALSSLHHADDLYLWGNPLLGDCTGILHLIDPVDDYEPGPGIRPIPDLAKPESAEHLGALGENAPGCNSVSEIARNEPLRFIRSGLTDSWYNPDTDGQGVFISVFPRNRELFMSWFTYDLERPDESVTAELGEPGHRWLTAQGPYPYLDPETKTSDNKAALLDLWLTQGGVFNAPEPQPWWEPDGTVFLEFETCSTASLTYEIPSQQLSGTIPLVRLALDNVWRCYEQDKKGDWPKADD